MAVAAKEEFGYSFREAPASLVLLIARELDGKKLPFELSDFHVSIRGEKLNTPTPLRTCEATVKVVVRGAQHHRVSDGKGPVAALDAALHLALDEIFSRLKDVRLTDYSVRLVDNTGGAASKTVVSIEFSDGTDAWNVAGVSEDLVEASLLALIDGYEYALLPVMSKVA